MQKPQEPCATSLCGEHTEPFRCMPARYIYIYMLPPPLTYPRFVLELSGIVIVSLQIFAISTVLGHM